MEAMGNYIPSIRSLKPEEINRSQSKPKPLDNEEERLLKMSLPRRKDGRIHISKHEFKLDAVSDLYLVRPDRSTDTELFEFSSGAGIENDKWTLKLAFRQHSIVYGKRSIWAFLNLISEEFTRAICFIYVVDNKQNEIFIGYHPDKYRKTGGPLAHWEYIQSPEVVEQFFPNNKLLQKYTRDCI